MTSLEISRNSISPMPILRIKILVRMIFSAKNSSCMPTVSWAKIGPSLNFQAREWPMWGSSTTIKWPVRLCHSSKDHVVTSRNGTLKWEEWLKECPANKLELRVTILILISSLEWWQTSTRTKDVSTRGTFPSNSCVKLRATRDHWTSWPSKKSLTQAFLQIQRPSS